jgi:hypothetical protein
MIQQICKCCGNKIEIAETARLATCPYCEKKQTLPLFSNLKLIRQYTEICTLRQSGQFAKASQLLDTMLQTVTEDSEWYWQRLLCRYGFVYLKKNNPANAEKKEWLLQCTLPTETPISADADYQAALQHATSETKSYYEAEGTLLEQERQKEQDVSALSEERYNATLESGFASLDAEQWALATAQFNLALRKRPHDENACLGNMMAQLQVRREEDLLQTGSAMEKTPQYAELMQYAKPEFRKKIEQYQRQAKYRQAVTMKEKANSTEDLQAAIDLLESMPAYPDAERLAIVCKRQLRERMLAYSEVLIGCHAADNLILSDENDENRIIVAKYYYDSDTKEEEASAKAAEKRSSNLKQVDVRIWVILILIVGVAVAATLLLLFRLGVSQPAVTTSERHNTAAMQTPQVTTKTDTSETTLSEDVIVCQETLPDGTTCLFYQQGDAIAVLYADGTTQQLEIAADATLSRIAVDETENIIAVVTKSGALTLWSYNTEQKSYTMLSAFYDPETSTCTDQLQGWDIVSAFTLTDQILIGTDQTGMPVKAVLLQF